MPNFQNGKIYKLHSVMDDAFYIGSTTQQLSKVKSKFVTQSKTSQSKVITHFKKIGWPHVDVTLIEQYPCNNKTELLLRQRFWTDTLKPTLNTCAPTSYCEICKDFTSNFQRHVKTKKHKNKSDDCSISLNTFFS